jgi:hypothetical protein
MPAPACAELFNICCWPVDAGTAKLPEVEDLNDVLLLAESSNCCQSPLVIVEPRSFCWSEAEKERERPNCKLEADPLMLLLMTSWSDCVNELFLAADVDPDAAFSATRALNCNSRACQPDSKDLCSDPSENDAPCNVDDELLTTGAIITASEKREEAVGMPTLAGHWSSSTWPLLYDTSAGAMKSMQVPPPEGKKTNSILCSLRQNHATQILITNWLQNFSNPYSTIKMLIDQVYIH